MGAGTLLDPAELFRSGDGGQSWHEVRSIAARQYVSPENVQLLALSFADPEHGWAVLQPENATPAGTVLTLYRIVDGGASWMALPAIPQDTKNRYAMLSFLSATTGFAASFWGHLAAAVGGHSWTYFDLGALAPAHVAFADSSHGWLWDQQGRVWRTSDAGSTWVPLP